MFAVPSASDASVQEPPSHLYTWTSLVLSPFLGPRLIRSSVPSLSMSKNTSLQVQRSAVGSPLEASWYSGTGWPVTSTSWDDNRTRGERRSRTVRENEPISRTDGAAPIGKWFPGCMEFTPWHHSGFIYVFPDSGGTGLISVIIYPLLLFHPPFLIIPPVSFNSTASPLPPFLISPTVSFNSNVPPPPLVFAVHPETICNRTSLQPRCSHARGPE